MANRAEQMSAELVASVAAIVLQRMPQERAETVERFVRRFYANVPPADIVGRNPDQLYGAAVALWQWGAQRSPGTARVRAFNPRPDEHGWRAGHTVVEIVNDDMPFLVDSVTAELERLGLTVHLVIHPVFAVKRDAAGRAEDIAADLNAAGEGYARESFMHVEVDEQSSPAVLENLARSLERVLADVRAAVQDWRQMLAKLDEMGQTVEHLPDNVPQDEIADANAFIGWLRDDNFTFLGYREYVFEPRHDAPDAQLRIVPGAGLGVLRSDEASVFDGLRNFSKLPPEVRHFVRQPRLINVTKANHRATVHRPVHMDVVSLKTFGPDGEVTGERMFVGLFTSASYSKSPREVPVLRQKVERVEGRAGFAPKSHDGKALAHILDTYPRDELFQITEDELYEIAMGILHLQERKRIALFLRRDPFERFVSALVYVPRDRFNSELRIRLGGLLARAMNGEVTAYYVTMEEGPLARIHYIVRTEPGSIPDYDARDLEARLVEAARAWPDRLHQALIEAKGEERGVELSNRYAEAFPPDYRERMTAAAAVGDIDRIEQVREAGRLVVHMYRPIEAPENELRFKLYHAGAQVPLSDVLPMLENMGLKVIGEEPACIRPANGAGSREFAGVGGSGAAVWMHDFTTTTADGRAVDLGRVRASFEDAFLRVWSGEMEDDGFNRLVLAAGLGWREVVVLRAYGKYLRQARLPYAMDTVERTLAAHPAIARLIVALFKASLDPAVADDTQRHGLLVEIDHALDKVTNLDEDRILRRTVNVVTSTLRTNFWQKAADGGPKPYLSFKIDSRNVVDLPLPRPMVEIFVYSPRTEGVHLRGGKVARGGIRWSDRREDFRTEILGLMKAQMVKNSVIVPVGSKGGFVVKRPPPASAGREAQLAEGIECYKTLMRGLLDLTDNLKAGAVVVRENLRRRDGDDPYLVVAADKGTATFSDIANSVSIEYGHWLGDAFASGGSAGYDHKKMGITAKGGWEAVKRHFRELGRNIQAEDFTVVGVGDMSGDVFGNGMLLSRHIRLLAAFDHRHIFLDPTPDAARSWEERSRLFDLPRSSWDDYDKSLISSGGGVFERSAKSITVSPEVRACFGLERERYTPAELIQALLTAEVDLLWFGGIGTYVKAADETHADVGDKGNDPLRVDAAALRAKVIGEGANLGMTQRARVEFAQKGGRINTDAIDNSAGVDCSDHEVNIKILLGDVVDRGDMTGKQRDTLLAEMTDEVGALVLRDNYLQTQALTLEQARGPAGLDAHIRFMRSLERGGLLNRAIEYLPDEEEIARRQGAGEALTRPELAVLLAYSKIALYDALLPSDLPDAQELAEDLAEYFPTPLRERFRPAIERHKLRREIIATVLANSLVNRAGPTFVHEFVDLTGHGAGDVTRAYIAARDAFGLEAVWSGIEGLDTIVPAAVQTAMLRETQALLERAVGWFLSHARLPFDIAAETAAVRPAVEALASHLPAILDEDARATLAERSLALTDAGVPETLALRVAMLPLLAAATDLARIAKAAGAPMDNVARIYFALGQRLGINWLRGAAGRMAVDSHWEKQALAATVDDLYSQQSELTLRVLQTGGAGADAVDAWVTARKGPIERLEGLVAELRGAGAPDIAMLTVATRRLRGLTAG